MKKVIKFGVISIAALLMLGCSTSQKVQVVQAGDQNLNCKELKSELVKLDQAQADIDSKKGLTGTNVASAVFWLPGLAYTFYDAGEANRLISDRRSTLTGHFNEKNCKK